MKNLLSNSSYLGAIFSGYKTEKEMIWILWQYDILTSKMTKYEQRSTKMWPKARSSSAMGTIDDRYLVIFGGDLNHSSR